MQKYYKAVRKLRKECPTLYPVRVRRTTIGRPLYGDCGFHKSNETFSIRILKTLDEINAIETLIHEWAHAMTWFALAAIASEGDHNSEWGVAYARCYRALYLDR